MLVPHSYWVVKNAELTSAFKSPDFVSGHSFRASLTDAAALHRPLPYHSVPSAVPFPALLESAQRNP